MRVNAANLALGHETLEAAGATFVRNDAFPAIRDANHVTAITASTADEIDALFARADAEFAHCPHRAFKADVTTPPRVEGRLLLDGYTREDALVSVLDGDLDGVAKPHDLRPIDDGGAWRAFELLQAADWRESRARRGETEQGDAAAAMAQTRRLKSPRVRYWLAFEEGQPAGYFSAWEGIAGVGQVEDLYVVPERRHRGLATALIHHCVADCRAHGAGPVVIVSDPTDTPKHMYAAMGFRPVAVVRNYWKAIA